MARFSRNTIAELVDAVDFQYHSQVEEFVFKFEMEEADRDAAIRVRAMGIKKYLADNPDKLGPSGASLIVEVFEYLFEKRLGSSTSYETRKPEEIFPNLVHCLKRDGFIIANNKLRPLLPEVVPIAEAEDEVASLLDRFEFSTAKGHLDQSISAHTRGEWASANAQLRSFFESLFDSMAEILADDSSSLPSTSHARRELLSKLDPPFLLPTLNEWESKGTGFVQGLWKRLHPEGSHPGLSDEEDSTFRLHLVILVASHYLRRLATRTESGS